MRETASEKCILATRVHLPAVYLLGRAQLPHRSKFIDLYRILTMPKAAKKSTKKAVKKPKATKKAAKKTTKKAKKASPKK